MAVNNVQSVFTELNSKSSVATANEAGSADRFLKLLVAQMQNQDPLSPMDNAQVTSQMAQINAVTGLEKLNTTVQGLSSQFVQMQALQGAALVGTDVVVPGNKIDVQDGIGHAGYELTGPADAVKVEVLSAAGQVIDTLNLGAQSIGMHDFEWAAGSHASANGLTFRVSATNAGNTIGATALMRDRVDSVSTSADKLMLELQKSGNVAYTTVKAFN
jgi:flagellar basal-body rod modification protein FlgD